jgi:ubiquinone/menaquinone biosynthesis C-methylase UbiE
MDAAEFDHFADEYEQQHAGSIRLSGEARDFFAQYKIIDVAQACIGRQPRRILDFGAGIGSSIPHFKHLFPDAALTCLDVSERSLKIARNRHGDVAEYRTFDGNVIPYPAGHFDLAFASCVFHHIPADRHVWLLKELRRVVVDDAPVFVFEHNPLNPLTRYAVNACPFDRNAVLLTARTLRARARAAGFAHVKIAYRLFFPGFLRALRPLERGLTRIPFGAQYYICATP